MLTSENHGYGHFLHSMNTDTSRTWRLLGNKYISDRPCSSSPSAKADLPVDLASRILRLVNEPSTGVTKAIPEPPFYLESTS